MEYVLENCWFAVWWKRRAGNFRFLESLVCFFEQKTVKEILSLTHDASPSEYSLHV